MTLERETSPTKFFEFFDAPFQTGTARRLKTSIRIRNNLSDRYINSTASRSLQIDPHVLISRASPSIRPRLQANRPRHVARCGIAISRLLRAFLQYMRQDQSSEESEGAGQERTRRETCFGDGTTWAVSASIAIQHEPILDGRNYDGTRTAEEEWKQRG